MIGDTPLTLSLRQEIAEAKMALSFLRKLPLGETTSTSLAEAQCALASVEQSLSDILTTVRDFNRVFQKVGWCASDQLSVNIMKHALSEAASGDIASGEEVLTEAMDATTIQLGIASIKRLPEQSKRWGLLMLAKEDYLQDRFHAVVPIVLAQADGLVNDFEPTGLFAEGTDLVSEESIAGHPDALGKVVKLFSQSRKKTHEEELRYPHRNGIMHGCDVGFGNKIVAAKAWALLFAASDLLVAKRNSHKTKSRPSIKETMALMAKNRAGKARLAEFQQHRERKDAGGDETSSFNQDEEIKTVVTTCLEALQAKKYGVVAKHTHDLSMKPFNQRAGEIRSQLDFVDILEFSNIRVDHYAAAMAWCTVDVARNALQRKLSGPVEFIAMYHDEAGVPAIPPVKSCIWTVLQSSLVQLIHEWKSM